MKKYFLSFGLLLTVGLATVVCNSCGDGKDEPDTETTDPNKLDPTDPTISSTTDKGVVINGIKWATRNVDKPGTFTAKPEDKGMLYQWNSTVGWSSTDPRTSTDGSSWNPDWNGNNATTWEKTNNVCPSGWRVPTQAELTNLANTDSEWTTIPVNGRIFGNGDNALFLPATNYRHNYDGSLDGMGTVGYYWSSTPESEPWIFFLKFSKNSANLNNSNLRPGEGISVRCVAEIN